MTPAKQQWWDQPTRLATRLLLCLLPYLAVVVLDYWLVDTHKITVRSGITFIMILTVTAFLAALIVACNPQRKSQ